MRFSLFLAAALVAVTQAIDLQAFDTMTEEPIKPTALYTEEQIELLEKATEEKLRLKLEKAAIANLPERKK